LPGTTYVDEDAVVVDIAGLSSVYNLSI